MTLEQLKNEHLGLCVSGGLDSRTVACRLVELGAKVTCFTADLAQPDEADIQDVVTKMAPCGAETVVVDLKDAMGEACLDMIRAQATYDGGYWNTTGIARAVTVHGLLAQMKARGCTVLVHGATGRGNDQMRFERYTNVLEPDMTVYAPWRDPAMLEQFPGRIEMVDYLATKGIEAFPGVKKRYSTDANLAGLSHEADDLESLQTACTIVAPTMGVWPHDAPDAKESVTIGFEAGLLTSINGNAVTPFAGMVETNAIGGRNGIGITHALENRIVGTKSRGVYEAPGMELVARCLQFLYQSVLDRRATALFEHLSQLVSDQVYDGRYYDPATTAALRGIETLAEPATGEVTVGLYRGNIYFESLGEVAGSIYCEDDASMEASSGLNPVSSQGFAEIQSIEARALARGGQVRRG